VTTLNIASEEIFKTKRWWLVGILVVFEGIEISGLNFLVADAQIRSPSNLQSTNPPNSYPSTTEGPIAFKTVVEAPDMR
jgi:hypothetical protein